MQMYFWTIAAIWLIPLVTCYIKNGDLCATESNLELSYPLKSNLGMHHSSWQHNRLLSSWEVSSEMGRIEHMCNFFVWSLGRGHQHTQLFSGDMQTQQNTEVVGGISETLAGTVPSWQPKSLCLRTIALISELWSEDTWKGVTADPC